MRIERVAQPAGRKIAGQIEMRDLRQRMHAGIGAAGALHAHGLADGRLDRRLERALHGRLMVLHLPAAERAAVVFDHQPVARHRLKPRRRHKRRAAQKFRRRHRRLAGALQLHDADRALAAGDGQKTVEQRARRARPFGQRAAQQF